MEIIGLSGYARSGKDAAAKVLVEEFGFTRVAFADKLRDFLYALNPIVSYKGWKVKQKAGQSRWRWEDVESGPETFVTVQNVIDAYTWDGYKESEYGPEIRRLLQRLGTEAGRQTLWDSIWVDAALTGHPDDAKLVVTDCRFPNEAQAIKERGGRLWRISRPGVGPANSHASETSLDDWEFDYRLRNNGDLNQLRQLVRRVYKRPVTEGSTVIGFAKPLSIPVEEKEK